MKKETTLRHIHDTLGLIFYTLAFIAGIMLAILFSIPS